MNDITPGQVYRETGRWFGPALVVGLALLALALILGLVGWRAGWWFAAQNATRQYQVTQNGTSNQETLRAQITSRLADVTTITTQLAGPGVTQDQAAGLKAQRMAIAGIACSDGAQITGVPLPADQAQWVTVNCSDGSVSPSSAIYVTGAP